MDDTGSLRPDRRSEADLERLAVNRIRRAAAEAAIEDARRARDESGPPAAPRFWLDEYLSAGAGGISPSVLFVRRSVPPAATEGVIEGGSDAD